jgi:Protein of unknown function (DUF2934)
MTCSGAAAASNDTRFGKAPRVRLYERWYYKLWEENGCPNGRDVELWEQAEDLIAIEENPDAGLLPNPSNRDPALAGVEEAEIQEN